LFLNQFIFIFTISSQKQIPRPDDYISTQLQAPWDEVVALHFHSIKFILAGKFMDAFQRQLALAT